MRKLLTIDRRVIFVLVFAAVTLATLYPGPLRQVKIEPSAIVRGIYDAVDKLDPGAPIMVALDFDPSAAPELEPMGRAVLRQCFRKRLHAIGMTHWNTGLALAEEIMRQTAMEYDDVELDVLDLGLPRDDVERKLRAIRDEKSPEAALAKLADFASAAGRPVERRRLNFARDRIPLDEKRKARDLLWHLRAGEFAAEPVPVVAEGGKTTGYAVARVVSRKETVTYGKDWCFLGYKPGLAILMISMGQNLYASFPTDKYNTSTRELPILKNVGSLADLKFLVELAAGSTGEQWIVYGAERYGFPMGVGCTAVIAPDLYPYYGSHQIRGLAGGIKGAWDYEKLVGVPDRATDAAPVQTVAHLLVMALIVLCNIAYFASRRGAAAPG